MNLVILASGRGSRLGNQTKTKPKCLIKVYENYTLIDHIAKNFNLFQNVIITTGYKSQYLKKKLRLKKINFVHNKNYLKTNMVESLMLIKKKLKKKDIIITYSDIFYDVKIINKLIKIKGNVLPLNPNWLKSWKKRYLTDKKIRNDAEDLIVSNGRVKSIGNKIKGKLPIFQYMGILKLEYKTFLRLEKFYKKMNNKKISLTHFIDETIKAKIVKYKYSVFNNYWYEVDNIDDLNFLKKTFN